MANAYERTRYWRCILGQYLIRRILQAIPLLLFVSILMFLLIHSLPGGPEAAYDNPQLDPAGRAALRASFGLDDPLPVQYLKWIGNALRGNFGFSFKTSQAVTDVIAQRLSATLELFLSAMVLALVLTL